MRQYDFLKLGYYQYFVEIKEDRKLISVFKSYEITRIYSVTFRKITLGK
jgi:hypothetical protein